MMPNEPQTSDVATVDGTAKTRPFLAQILLYLGIAGVPGALAALIAIGMERGFDWVILGLAAAFAFAGYFVVRYALKVGNFEPPSLKSKAGRNQAILVLSAFIGVLIGVYFNLTGRIDQIVEGNFALSPREALVGMGILLLFIPIAYFWHRSIDEHEAAASNSAAMVSIYIYFYGYIGWTLAHYANLMPAMNGFALFWIVIFSFCGIWAFKRSG